MDRNAELRTALNALSSTGTSNGWSQARCPAHNDANASFGYRINDDGTVQVKCHRGCETQAILEALGFTMRDLFPLSKGGYGKQITAAYDYTDKNGNPLYQVVRFLPKNFRQRRPDGKGGWHWDMKGVKRVLYRLPAVRKAIKENKRVYITEGEKDADTLARLRFCSTTNVGGAGKWRDEYTECLKGARVVIIPDNDAPGLAHAADVSTKLQGVAKSVRVVRVPKGKDVTEWVENHGGSKAKLLEPVKAAKRSELLAHRRERRVEEGST